jgi:hypothetical protein
MSIKRNGSGILKPQIFHRDIGSSFTEDLLPVIQNLTALGYNDTEIGTIVGFAGQLTRDWLRSLTKERTDVTEAIKTGRLLAKAVLIGKLVHTSLGYDYKETDEIWLPNGETKSNGQKKWVLQRKVVHRRHQTASVPAMLQLAARLLPDVFSDNKSVDVIDVTEEQIKKLAGRINEIPRQCPTILDTSTERTESEYRIPGATEQGVGEGPKLPNDNAPVDS